MKVLINNNIIIYIVICTLAIGIRCVQTKYSDEQCLIEIDKLSNDIKLIEARKRLGNVVCTNIKDVGCVGDYDDVAGTISYTNRCYELDGQMFWLHEHQRCTPTSHGSQTTVNKVYLNKPYCLGTSCTQADVLQQEQMQHSSSGNGEYGNEVAPYRGQVCESSFESVFRTTLSGECAIEDNHIADTIVDLPYLWKLHNESNSVSDSAPYSSVERPMVKSIK